MSDAEENENLNKEIMRSLYFSVFSFFVSCISLSVAIFYNFY